MKVLCLENIQKKHDGGCGTFPLPHQTGLSFLGQRSLAPKIGNVVKGEEVQVVCKGLILHRAFKWSAKGLFSTEGSSGLQRVNSPQSIQVVCKGFILHRRFKWSAKG